MKPYLVVLSLSLILGSCRNNDPGTVDKDIAYHCPMQCEGDKTYGQKGSCPICKMDLVKVENKTKERTDRAYSDMSIYNLPSTWTTQNGTDIQLKDLQGDVLVMVMIYTSCKAACPRLVADMRNIEERLPEHSKKNVKMIFVSIDPETDTPERLKAFAKEKTLNQGKQERFSQVETVNRKNEKDRKAMRTKVQSLLKNLEKFDLA